MEGEGRSTGGSIRARWTIPRPARRFPPRLRDATPSCRLLCGGRGDIDHALIPSGNLDGAVDVLDRQSGSRLHRIAGVNNFSLVRLKAGQHHRDGLESELLPLI